VEPLPKIDETGLKILFLLLPGIITLLIVKSIGPKRPRTDLETGLQIFIYGIVSYALAGLVEGLYTWFFARPPIATFLGVLASNTIGLATLSLPTGLSAGQIVSASAVAIALGVVLSYLATHSVAHNILRVWHMTSRTSENDIWGFALNSPNIDSWVTVRHENGKVYQGWVRAYSDPGDEPRELLLADVKIFAPAKDNPDELVVVDTLPVVYLGLDRNNVIVEMLDTK